MGSLETVIVPIRNCYYTGRVSDHQFSRVAVSMCDGEMVCTNVPKSII